MRKLSKILSVLLCAVALSSTFTFAACGGGNDGGNQGDNSGTQTDDSGNQGGNTGTKPDDSGNQGGNTDTKPDDSGNQGGNTGTKPGDSGNQGGNTGTKPGDSGNQGGNQPEQGPSTTVTNEAEWKKAFDFASLNNFTMVGSMVGITDNIKRTCQIDLINCKLLGTTTADMSEYYEYSDGALWTASMWGGMVTVEKDSDYADAATARQKILSLLDLDEISEYANMYSDFRFNSDDCYYVCEDKTGGITLKIKIVNGMVAEYIEETITGSGKITVVYEFKEINSTVLQIPQWARTAIDEKINGNKPEPDPSTTVANEEEWKKALDLLSLNSFTVFEVDHYEALTDDDITKINGVVDMANCKAGFTTERKGNSPYYDYRYFEYKSNTFWNYDSSNYEKHGVYDTPTTEEGARDCLKELLTAMETNRAFTTLSVLTNPIFDGATDGEAKAVTDLFSEFTYENGYYISNLLIASDGTFSYKYKIEIAIKDGVLSEAKIKMGEKEIIEWLTLKVTDVNSTVVTASADARKAIDEAINGNQPGKEPVTTVANEEEWRKAFDFSAVNNYTMVGIMNNAIVTCQIDLVNCKLLGTATTGMSEYHEFSDGAMWTSSLSNGTTTVEKDSDCADAATARQKILSTLGMEEISQCAGIYSYFRYNSDDCYYVCEDKTSGITLKIKIADGMLAEYNVKLVTESENITVVYEFKDINSTSFQTPQWARTSIDEAKARG